MKTGASRNIRRSIVLATACILAVMLTACTGRGGGQLPPDGVIFKGSASFGFSFSCEDTGGFNPPPGQLQIQLSYTDKGSNPLGSSFGIHGIVDTIDPVLESQVCSGPNPPEPDNELMFLGRYRLTSSSPDDFPEACRTETPTCRFEVIVRDNDKNGAPSTADYFQIRLSSGTVLDDELDPVTAPVFYTRAGLLSSGNLTVD